MALKAKRLGVSVHTGSGIADGARVLAKHTILAEGAFGTVAAKLATLYNSKPMEPQTHALGIREE